MSLSPIAIREILDTIEDEHLLKLSMIERSIFETIKDAFDRNGALNEKDSAWLERVWCKLP